MNTRAIIAVIFRLFAFYLFFQFLLALPQSANIIARISISDLGNAMNETRLIYSAVSFQIILMFLAYVPLAILIFIKADTLSHFFVKDDAKEITFPAVSDSHLLVCVYRGIGIYAIIHWAPGLTQIILQSFIYALHPEYGTFHEILFADWPNLISFTVGTLIGVRLAFAPKGKWPCPL